MARTIFVTKELTDSKIATEQGTRIQEDSRITGSINTNSQKVAENTTNLATLSAGLTAETNNRQTQIGNLSFTNLLTSESLIPANITEAINATTILKDNLASQLASVDVPGYLALKDDIDGLRSKVNQDNAKLENILLNANVDYNTFEEIVNLISTKDAATAASLSTLETTLQALINTKMDKVQTVDTALEYVDVNDISKKYKIIIVDGQLAVEDIL